MPFPPHNVANPFGRPKGQSPMTQLANKIKKVTNDGQMLIDFYFEIFSNKAEKYERRKEAADWLADHGFGRPAPAFSEEGIQGQIAGQIVVGIREVTPQTLYQGGSESQ